MQKITMYLRANDTLATQVDQYNDIARIQESIVRGMQVELLLNLLNNDGTPLALENYASWMFVLASDWDITTPPQILVETGITATNNTVRIPILDTNTEELVTWLGTAETKSIGAELVGFRAGESSPNFVLQFTMNVRNRRSAPGCGEPTELPDNYYTKQQTDALLSAADVFQFVKAAGTTPTPAEEATAHSTQANDDTHYRQRNSSVGGDWSGWMRLIRGPQGEPGATHYHYIAYASDSEGTDFSLQPSDDLHCRAEFLSTTYIATPTLADFQAAGATFVLTVASKAEEISITDEGEYYEGDTVEEALQEAGARLDEIENVLAGLGTFLANL